MRCLSIAYAFANRGIKTLFIAADEKGKTLIEQSGFDFVCLKSKWNDMCSEIPAFTELIDSYNPKLILIDSYYVTQQYLNVLSNIARTVYIDDINAEKWNVDYLINYNIFAFIYDYSWYNGTHTNLLLGSSYIPLRDEFRNRPTHNINDVTKILISAGGADPERITERVMDEICSEMPDINFHFIVGALNPRLNDIKSMAEKKSNAILHINEKHMSKLMSSCDIAVSAAGSTLYELCACGIPTVTYSLADNQIIAAEEFDRRRIMLNAGDCRGNAGFIDSVKKHIYNLMQNEAQRKELSRKMQNLVDGKGANRIVAELL